MSLKQLCSRHKVKHQRGISVRGSAGGAIRSWQVLLPNPKLCRIMPTAVDTNNPFGRESVEYDHVAYFTCDPQAIEQDQLLFLDKSTTVLGGLCQSATNGTAAPPVPAVPSITLASSASSVNNFYTGNVIEAAGQWNVVGAYNGSTKVAAVVLPWAVVPNANSGYVISTGRLRTFWVVGEKEFDFVKRLYRVELQELRAKQ